VEYLSAQYLPYALTAYVALMAAFIIAENRRPQATFAWMFLFLTLPLAGLAVYWLFGRRNRDYGRTRTLLRQDLPEHLAVTLAEIEAQHGRAMARLASDPYPWTRLASLVHSSAHAFVTIENRAEILQDASGTYPRLMEDMRAARSSIHLQYFSWASDALGEELRALLTRKAKQGVEVRLLYDPAGSLLMLRRAYVRAMREGGIEMRPASPLWRLHTISYRNHRKIAVIDGAIGYTGGLNIGREHIDPPSGFDRWRDTHLRVEGAAARALQAVFAVDWANATGERLLEPAHFPPLVAGADPGETPGLLVQLCLSGPDSQWRAVRQQYFGMIVGARRRIRAQSPFFILDDTIAEALKTAALAGIDVAVMLSERGTDQHVPYWAANTYMAEVAEAGVKILLYRPGYLHAKTIVVDGEIASVGSANWDIRSFAINYELNALLYDRGLAAELEEAFERDRARCRPFDPAEYRARPLALRFRDSLARLASPLL